VAQACEKLGLRIARSTWWTVPFDKGAKPKCCALTAIYLAEHPEDCPGRITTEGNDTIVRQVFAWFKNPVARRGFINGFDERDTTLQIPSTIRLFGTRGAPSNDKAVQGAHRAYLVWYHIGKAIAVKLDLTAIYPPAEIK
jgi:hypothetical protein